MYQTANRTLRGMTSARPGSGCSRLIMEAQTVGLINREGSTRSMCKSFCHAEALSREQLGRSSRNSWHLAPPHPLNHKRRRSHHGGLRGDQGIFLIISLLLTQINTTFYSRYTMFNGDIYVKRCRIQKPA